VVSTRRLPLLAALLAGLALTACGGAAPHVKVMGAEQGRSDVGRPVLRVFVEVVNPTGGVVDLARLDYDLSADQLFARRGTVEVDRKVGAGSTAIVEIAVPVDPSAVAKVAGVPYRLAGRLYAHADAVDRYWNVDVRGELQASPRAGDHLLRVKLGASSSTR
jgi:hypothetical protein